MFVCLFFFFKQKTAYEMRISDWSSDVCSSDLQISCAATASPGYGANTRRGAHSRADREIKPCDHSSPALSVHRAACAPGDGSSPGDRKSAVSGKGVAGRVDLGGSRLSKKKKQDVRHTCPLQPHKRIKRR